MHAGVEGMEQREVTYRRDELYEQVWAEPVREVAKRYGVSDVALAKTCRRLSVPLPGRGYWAKKRAGRAPKRPPLPPSSGPQSVVVERQAAPEVNAGQRRTEIPEVAVAESLRRAHPLVAAVLEEAKTERAHKGLYSFSWRGKLDVSASRDSLKRALRIMDALIKHLERNGTEVRVARERVYRYGSADDRNWATQALCAGEWVGFALRERQRRVEVPPPGWAKSGGVFDHPRSELEPSGVLELSLTSYRLSGLRKVWADGKKQRLEDLLGQVVVGLAAAGEHLREVHAEDRRREEAYAEAQRRREEEAERRRREEERAARLLAWVQRWREARDVRAFVGAARSALGAGDIEIEPGVSLRDELSWALEYAERIDPLSDSVSAQD